MFSGLKKQQRQLAAAAIQGLQTTQVGVRGFTASAQTPTEQSKKAEEWGEKYSDECFAFEKEWEAIANKIENE